MKTIALAIILFLLITAVGVFAQGAKGYNHYKIGKYNPTKMETPVSVPLGMAAIGTGLLFTLPKNTDSEMRQRMGLPQYIVATALIGTGTCWAVQKIVEKARYNKKRRYHGI